MGAAPQLQYVFVDESERNNKRPKISRACDSCRKRKVKCDVIHMAAGEPCTSCRRLHVECVLPQVQGPDEMERPRLVNMHSNSSDLVRSENDYSPSIISGQFHNASAILPNNNNNSNSNVSSTPSTNDCAPVRASPLAVQQQNREQSRSVSLSEGSSDLQSVVYAPPVESRNPPPAMRVQQSAPYASSQPHNGAFLSTPQQATIRQLKSTRRKSSSTGGKAAFSRKTSHRGLIPQMVSFEANPSTDQAAGDKVSVDSLSSVFDKLHVQVNGQSAIFADQPDSVVAPRTAPIISPEQIISRAITGKHSATGIVGYPFVVRDIADLLPPEDLAMDLFTTYFTFLHPYTPIIDRASFIDEWLHNRDNLSPFLLVSVFALASRFSDDPRVCLVPGDRETRGDLWWNLVPEYRHQFSDAPRISTVQAEILNMKSLETRPQTRGFFYRGWHQLASNVRMARDLSLHKLVELRSVERDVILGKRMWQVLFILDHIMGTSQARDRMTLLDEVDLTLVPPELTQHHMTASEVDLHNDFVYMVGCYKIMRRATDTYYTQGITFPFHAMPIWVSIDDAQVQWRMRLPSRLAFNPIVDSALPSHFVGHLLLSHSLHVLAIHRAFIVSTGEYGASGAWRHHLRLCNETSRELTSVMEGLLRQYGDESMFFHIRGSTQAIYAAIVATMLLAVCVTCPEPEFSDGAPAYLERCLNVLSRLAKRSGTPAMAKQAAGLKHVLGGRANTPTLSTFNPDHLPEDLQSIQRHYREMRESREQFVQTVPGMMYNTGEEQYFVGGGFAAGGTNNSSGDNYGGLAPTIEVTGGATQEFQYDPPAIPDHAVVGEYGGNLPPHSQWNPDYGEMPGYAGPALAGWDPSPLIGAWTQSFPQLSAPANTQQQLQAQIQQSSGGGNGGETSPLTGSQVSASPNAPNDAFGSSPRQSLSIGMTNTVVGKAGPPGPTIVEERVRG